MNENKEVTNKNLNNKDCHDKDPKANTNASDASAPFWHCNTYCRKVRHIYCEGQEHVREDAPEQCPYFDEMLY